MNKFFRYQGSKEHILYTILRLIVSNTKYRIYAEPFLGSGTVFINLPDIFDEYRINDLNENVMSMWKAILSFSYKDYQDAQALIFDKFGDIRENKDAYYRFRDDYNTNLHFSDKKEKGLFLYFLANSCINSMLRFGPNGMNQSWGNRLYFFEQTDYNIISNKLKKSVLTSVDYKKVIRGINKAVVYVDPPYYVRHTSYEENFEQTDLLKLIELLRLMDGKNDIYYSDIETDTSNLLMNDNFTKVYAKDMRNISPLRSSEFIDEREVLYHNIKSRFFL